MGLGGETLKSELNRYGIKGVLLYLINFIMKIGNSRLWKLTIMVYNQNLTFVCPKTPISLIFYKINEMPDGLKECCTLMTFQ